MNSVALAGRLAKEPKVIQGKNGNFVKITIACKVSKEKADFIDCLAFRKTADFITNYLHTGDFIHCQGYISRTKSVNQQNQTIYATNIVIRNIDVLTKSKKSLTLENNLSNLSQKDSFMDKQKFFEVTDQLLIFGYSETEIKHGIYNLLSKDKYDANVEDIVAELIPKIDAFNEEVKKDLDDLAYYEEEKISDKDEELVDINELVKNEEDLEMK